VVAGDGTGDRLLVAAARGPFAWRPGFLSQLAYVSASHVLVRDVDSGRVLWHAGRRSTDPVLRMMWSADGKELLQVTAHSLRVYDARGHALAPEDGAPGAVNTDATFVGSSHLVALLVNGRTLSLFGSRGALFEAGGLRQLVSSPDGQWLLVTWPAANQWVFVRVQAPHTIRAYSGITGQFGRGTFPVVAGWIGK